MIFDHIRTLHSAHAHVKIHSIFVAIPSKGDNYEGKFYVLLAFWIIFMARIMQSHGFTPGLELRFTVKLHLRI